jgi:hypothetical protein
VFGPLGVLTLISSPYPQQKSKTNPLLRAARRCGSSDAEDKIQSGAAATKQLTKAKKCDRAFAARTRAQDSTNRTSPKRWLALSPISVNLHFLPDTIFFFLCVRRRSSGRKQQ